MKRSALYGLAIGTAASLTAPSAAQQNGQVRPPIVQPAGATAPVKSAQANDLGSKATDAKEKICAPVLIRAGPNQGQIISKCRHTDRSRPDSQPH